MTDLLKPSVFVQKSAGLSCHNGEFLIQTGQFGSYMTSTALHLSSIPVPRGIHPAGKLYRSAVGEEEWSWGGRWAC